MAGMALLTAVDWMPVCSLYYAKALFIDGKEIEYSGQNIG